MKKHPCIGLQNKGEECSGCAIAQLDYCSQFQITLGKIYNHLKFRYGSISEEDRDDIITNTLEGVLKGIRNYEGRGGAKFSTWVRQIYRNKVSDHFRKNKYQLKEWDIHKLSNNPFQEKKMIDKITECFRINLPDDTTGCLKLYLDLYRFFIRGQKQKDLAVSYNLKPNTLNQRIKRCRKTIKQIFKAYF